MTLSSPKARRRLTREDILPPAEYAATRRERRRRITELKQHRRVAVGPYTTFHFENFDTMWQQVHEMLYIEKGGEEQIRDELEAYNPLIPQGRELIATVMFEIPDAARRNAVLARLGGVEDRLFLDVAGERIRGEPDPTRENTSSEGKASSVQFMRFPFSEKQVAAFKTVGTTVLVGCDHPDYGHIAVMPETVRAVLAEDFD